MNFDGVQPEEQILPEGLLSGHRIEILVRRCHKPQVETHLFGSADPAKLLCFQDTQNLGLCHRAQVSDLVQKYGPAVR